MSLYDRLLRVAEEQRVLSAVSLIEDVKNYALIRMQTMKIRTAREESAARQQALIAEVTQLIEVLEAEHPSEDVRNRIVKLKELARGS